MEAIEAAWDTETKARIQGVQSQMNTFNFLFGALLGELVLRHTDNLSRTLQNEFSAAEGQHTASLVADTLETLRNDESFDLFWAKVGRLSDQFDFEPQLPRKHRAPKRYETGLAEAEFHEDPKAYHRQHYYDAFDLVINCIKERFDQPGYEVYYKLEKLLVKAAQNQDVTSEFDNDLQPETLKAQLITYAFHFQRVYTEEGGKQGVQPTIFDIKSYFTLLSPAQRSLLSEVCTVYKLVLVMPAMNTVSERSFSGLCRVKDYCRSTMSQCRLNNRMVLKVYSELTDQLDMKAIGNEFITDSEHRQKILQILINYY